jgi:hypothetical protein
MSETYTNPFGETIRAKIKGGEIVFYCDDPIIDKDDLPWRARQGVSRRIVSGSAAALSQMRAIYRRQTAPLPGAWARNPGAGQRADPGARKRRLPPHAQR